MSLYLLKGKISQFLRYTFIKRQQHKFFQESKEKSNDRFVVVQVDFSENFAIKMQDEIQAAHWNHQQVTIFTGYVWYGYTKGTGYALISDELDHGKVAVYAFLEAFIN